MKQTQSGTFGDLLREKRLAAKLSASVLASSCGLAQAHLSRIETGARKPPRLSACLEMAKKLGIPKGSSEFGRFIRAAHHDRFPRHDVWMQQLGKRSRQQDEQGSEVVCGTVPEMVYKANEYAISNQAVEITVKGSSEPITFRLAGPHDNTA